MTTTQATNENETFRKLAADYRENEKVTIYGETLEWNYWVASALLNAQESDGCVENGTADEDAKFWAIARSTLEMHIDQIQD